MIGIFHLTSSAVKVLVETNAGSVCSLNNSIEVVYEKLSSLITSIEENKYTSKTDWAMFEKYTAKEMTKKQVELFNRVVS